MEEVSHLKFGIKAEAGFYYFIQHLTINLYSGNTPIDIMTLFPLAKMGYVLEPIPSQLIYIYAIVNNLIVEDDEFASRIIFDELLTTAFAGNIPSLSQITDEETVPKLLNTIDMYEHEYDCQGAFKPYNSLDKEAIDDLVDLDSLEFPLKIWLKNERGKSLVEKLRHEAATLQSILFLLQISTDEYKMVAPIDIYSFIKLYLRSISDYSHMKPYTKEINMLVDKIMYLPGIDLLCISIIFNDVEFTAKFLSICNPTNNNFKAYSLALESGNSQLIDMIKNNIIQRSLVEQEVFRTQIDQQIGPSNLWRSLYNYTKQL